MKELLVNNYLLPPWDWMIRALRFDVIWLEAHESFQKRSPRNRCIVLSDKGPLTLTVPVTKSNSHHRIQDVRLYQPGKWEPPFSRAIRSAYGKAPFFDQLFPEIEEILNKKHTHLWQLNLDFMTLCLRWLQYKGEVRITQKFAKITQEGIIDRRDTMGFTDKISPKPYMQVFGNKFVTNLSVLDVLFCEGIHGQILANESELWLNEH